MPAGAYWIPVPFFFAFVLAVLSSTAALSTLESFFARCRFVSGFSAASKSSPRARTSLASAAPRVFADVALAWSSTALAFRRATYMKTLPHSVR